MKTPAKRRYDKALDDYLKCADVSQMIALGSELAAAEAAWRLENPGKFHQSQQQIESINEAPTNEDR